MTKFANLAALRESFGYRQQSVAEATHIDLPRLQELENGDFMTVLEASELATVYGLDLLAISTTPIVQDRGIEVLTSLDEFREISDVLRMRVVRAANAARELRELRSLLKMPSSKLRSFSTEIHKLQPRLATESAPHKQGALLAKAVRQLLGLGADPIRSMRDLVGGLEGVELLYASLGPDGPAGLSFLDETRGPAVVLNLDGKNRNSLVRRFSLAHELCHLLFDAKGTPLASVSGFFTESKLHIERRANAFAVRLLCPEPQPQRIAAQGAEPAANAAELSESYGLPYSAVRLYLKNKTSVRLEPTPPVALTLRAIEDRWSQAEVPLGISDFPFPKTAEERRTSLARLAAQAYSRELIVRDRFAELIGLSATDDIGPVLDYFALDPPVVESVGAA